MHVKVAKIKLRLPTTTSLKDKRSIIKSLLARTKQEFHIAISEVEAIDDIREAILGVAMVCNNARLNESILRRVVTTIENHPEITLVDETTDELTL